MNIENEDNEVRVQSKFEWRPDDVEILSDEEAAAVLAEDRELRAERDKNSVTVESSTLHGDEN